MRRSWMRYNFITERYTKDEIDKIIAKGDKRYMTEETRMILERLDSMGQDLKESIGDNRCYLKLALEHSLRIEQTLDRMWMEMDSLRMDIKEVKRKVYAE